MLIRNVSSSLLNHALVIGVPCSLIVLEFPGPHIEKSGQIPESFDRISRRIRCREQVTHAIGGLAITSRGEIDQRRLNGLPGRQRGHQTVSRILARFQKAGLVKADRKRIALLNPDGLSEIAACMNPYTRFGP